MKKKTFDITVLSHPKQDQDKEENILNVTKIILPNNVTVQQDDFGRLVFAVGVVKTPVYNIAEKLNKDDNNG